MSDGATSVAAPTADTVTPDLHDPRERARVEEALRGIPGLLAVRVVAGFDRPIDELHVLSGPNKSPKQMVRDVQSLLFARFAVTIDHRVVSVVQLDEGDPGLKQPRIAISRVTSAQHGLRVEVVVTLSGGGEEFEGSAEGQASVAGRRRAIARATLEAAAPLLGDGRMVDVEGVIIQEMLGHTVAFTFVQLFGTKGESTVCGSAMVRGDESDAVARSVLDALNRAIEFPQR